MTNTPTKYQLHKSINDLCEANGFKYYNYSRRRIIEIPEVSCELEPELKPDKITDEITTDACFQIINHFWGGVPNPKVKIIEKGITEDQKLIEGLTGMMTVALREILEAKIELLEYIPKTKAKALIRRIFESNMWFKDNEMALEILIEELQSL